jgi:hypothetical protein
MYCCCGTLSPRRFFSLLQRSSIRALEDWLIHYILDGERGDHRLNARRRGRIMRFVVVMRWIGGGCPCCPNRVYDSVDLGGALTDQKIDGR